MTIVELLKKLVELKGSDLHLVAGLVPAVRVHGLLTPLEEAGRVDPETAREMVYSLLTEEQRRSFESDSQTRYELDFGYGVPGVGRFRCNVYKQRGSISAMGL